MFTRRVPTTRPATGWENFFTGYRWARNRRLEKERTR